MRRGFTLLELCFVVMIIGLLTAITVPTYDILIRRTHQTEARTMLSAIADAQLRHYRDSGSFLSCPASGEIPAPTAPFPKAECWEALHIQPAGEVRYRYSTAPEGSHFVVTAEGDLDRDGEIATLTLQGETLELTIVDGLD